MKVNGKDDPFFITENKTCSKPPIRIFNGVCWDFMEVEWEIYGDFMGVHRLFMITIQSTLMFPPAASMISSSPSLPSSEGCLLAGAAKTRKRGGSKHLSSTKHARDKV